MAAVQQTGVEPQTSGQMAALYRELELGPQKVVPVSLTIAVDGHQQEVSVLNGLHNGFVYKTSFEYDGQNFRYTQERHPVGGWEAWITKHRQELDLFDQQLDAE